MELFFKSKEIAIITGSYLLHVFKMCLGLSKFPRACGRFIIGITKIGHVVCQTIFGTLFNCHVA